jgi:hypothetical protein
MDCASQNEFSAGADRRLVVGGEFGEGGFFFDGDVAVLGRIEDFSTLLTLNKFGVFLAGDYFDNGMFADGSHYGEKKCEWYGFCASADPLSTWILDFCLVRNSGGTLTGGPLNRVWRTHVARAEFWTYTI